MSDGCYCHINPPCSYCVEKVECRGCEELVHPDDADYIADDLGEAGPFCKKCMDKILGRNKGQ